MLNQKCIIRTESAGVHYGVLKSREGREVTMTECRRIWHWKGGFTLNEIAVNGLNETLSRLSIAVPEILLLEAIEIIPVSEAAVTVLDRTKSYEP
ncbi:MAG TPA: hypothetical protein VIE69_06910 [Methylophilaceae bacterium]|jgi:hypothetical protein